MGSKVTPIGAPSGWPIVVARWERKRSRLFIAKLNWCRLVARFEMHITNRQIYTIRPPSIEDTTDTVLMLWPVCGNCPLAEANNFGCHHCTCQKIATVHCEVHASTWRLSNWALSTVQCQGCTTASTTAAGIMHFAAAFFSVCPRPSPQWRLAQSFQNVVKVCVCKVLSESWAS